MGKDSVEPREYTREEIRVQFLYHVVRVAKYWAELPDEQCTIYGNDRESMNRWRTEGVAHTILATLDGNSISLPGFALIPCPHPDDKEYHLAVGENHYPETAVSDTECDIGGGLHELLHNYTGE